MVSGDAGSCKRGCDEGVALESEGVADDDETGALPAVGKIWSASERRESELGSKKAQEASVKNDVFRFKRDALAGRKRKVQEDSDEFDSVRRGFGVFIDTMKSPLSFAGAVWVFEVTCEKTAPKTTKATLVVESLRRF